MAYSEQGRHGSKTYSSQGKDPMAQLESGGRGAASGIAIALGLLVLLMIGLSFIGGGGETTAPDAAAVEGSAPATEAAPAAGSGAEPAAEPAAPAAD